MTGADLANRCYAVDVGQAISSVAKVKSIYFKGISLGGQKVTFRYLIELKLTRYEGLQESESDNVYYPYIENLQKAIQAEAEETFKTLNVALRELFDKEAKKKLNCETDITTNIFVETLKMPDSNWEFIRQRTGQNVDNHATATMSTRHFTLDGFTKVTNNTATFAYTSNEVWERARRCFEINTQRSLDDLPKDKDIDFWPQKADELRVRSATREFASRGTIYRDWYDLTMKVERKRGQTRGGSMSVSYRCSAKPYNGSDLESRMVTSASSNPKEVFLDEDKILNMIFLGIAKS